MSQLLIAESPLVILPTLALKFGTNEAIFLQQLHYWLGKTDNVHNGIKWAYNTIQQWAEQLQIISVATIERAISKLKKLGVLLVDKLNPNKSDRTNFYSINYSKLAEVLGTQHCLNLMPSPHTNEVKEHRKLKVSITSKCGNLPTENTKENTKNILSKPTSKALEGTVLPIHPDPLPEQLVQMNDAARRLFRELRRQRLDIRHDDPRLQQWINQAKSTDILRLAAAVPYVFQTMQYQWHTVEQVIEPQLQQKWGKVA